MKHRTNESSELNCGVTAQRDFISQVASGTANEEQWGKNKSYFISKPRGAIEANGNCHCPPLLGLDPFWMKTVTKTPKDDHCWCRCLSYTPVLHPGPFVFAGKIVEAFSIVLEASGKWIFLAPSLNFQSSWYIITTQLNTVQILCCPYTLQTCG